VNRGREIALASAGAVLAVATLAPLVALIAELPSGAAGFQAWAHLRTWSLLGRSLGIASAVTAVALAIGIPLGVLFGRTDVIGRRTAWLVHAFAMFLPPLLPALGWFHLFGRNGLAGNETTANLLFGPIGLIVILGLAFAPIATSLVALGVAGVDRSLEESARTMARPWRVITRIVVPAASPAIALAAIAIFALALSELAVPMFLRVDVFPAAVFARLGGADYAPGDAFALVVPLIPIALALVALERRLVGRRGFAVFGMQDRSRHPLPLGRARVPATIACWLAALISIAPIGSLAIRAFRGGGFNDVLAWARRAPIDGLAAAAIAAAVIAVVGVIIGHALARRARGASSLDAIALLAFVMPAAVLGVGLIAVWNRSWTQSIYGTIGIVIVGFVARYSVIGIRVFATTVVQLSPHLEEAAAAAGAGYLRRLVRIVLPLGARGAGFAFLLALVFCLRDVETAILYYPPGREPLTVRIFTLEANGSEATVAALAVLHAGITAAVLAAGAALLARLRR
jgi:iron(III) transport system permease protein